MLEYVGIDLEGEGRIEAGAEEKEATMAGAQEWSTEKEGRIALLLRELAKAEREEDRLPIVEALREATQQNFGPELSKWLAWYLEDHLGMKNAIGILTGRSPGEVEEEPESHADEIIFDRAEYNWCALEKIKNKDDMIKLRMLYRDLETPIQTDVDGPFSFRRLTGLDEDELAFFRGKSIGRAIFDEGVQVRHLRVLKDYGKLMMMPVFPSATQRAGAIIYAAAISQALVRFDTKITSLSFKDLSESFPNLLDRPYLVDSFVRLFQEALAKCT